MSKKQNTLEKPAINTNAGLVVRRTHTAKSLTVREVPIAQYLVSKLAGSPIPEGFKLERPVLAKAFGVVGAFMEAIFEEAEASVAKLELLAKKGDDEAAKQVKQVKDALEEMHKYRASGKYDEIQQRIRDFKATGGSKQTSESSAKPAAKVQQKPAVSKPKQSSKAERREQLRKEQGKVSVTAPEVTQPATAVEQPAA